MSNFVDEVWESIQIAFFGVVFIVVACIIAYSLLMNKNNGPNIVPPIKSSKKKKSVSKHSNNSEIPNPKAIIEKKKASLDYNERSELLKSKELELQSMPATTFDRSKMENLLEREFWFTPSFAINSVTHGQYDFGPMACALKSNMLNAWRQFFVLEEQMLEVDFSILTPKHVLMASGHVTQFTDNIVKDKNSGECFHLVYLIQNRLEELFKGTTNELKEEDKKIIISVENKSSEEINATIKKYEIKLPPPGRILDPPTGFNTTLGTQLEQSNLILRPGIAQGIIVNFKRLLEFNQGKLPFTAAQIGKSFRNEISPKSALIYVREFLESGFLHFFDPNKKSHPKFDSIKGTVMRLYLICDQTERASGEEMKIGDAVKNGLVANETLGYFMARIQQYMLKIGILPDRLRFRQHMNNEMANNECWDAECSTSYGWWTCITCSDGPTYDLTQRTKATGVKLVFEKKLDAPKVVEVTEAEPKIDIMKEKFGEKAHRICEKLADVGEKQLLQSCLNSGGTHELKIDEDTFILTDDMFEAKKTQKEVNVEEITPSVIETSFDIGRIMYSLLEHRLHIRDGDEQRPYFALPVFIAPFKCTVLSSDANSKLDQIMQQISALLTRYDIPHKVRTDEVGIPYCVTIDLDTLKKPQTVKLRERDSMVQLSVPRFKIVRVIRDLSYGKVSWDEVSNKYPKIEQQEATK